MERRDATSRPSSLCEFPAREEFYGLAVGDRVCVHGEGFGVITDLHANKYPSGDSLTVQMDTIHCRCDSCGNAHNHDRVLHPHPRHVSKGFR